MTALGEDRLVYSLTSSANSFAVTFEKLSVMSLIKTSCARVFYFCQYELFLTGTV